LGFGKEIERTFSQTIHNLKGLFTFANNFFQGGYEMQETKKTIPLHKFMNSLFYGDVKTLPDLFEKERTVAPYKEIVIQVMVKGGKTIEMLTGTSSIRKAERHVDFALRYCREHHGEVLAWRWKGENVVRTPFRKSKIALLKDKVLDYFGLLD
jgi:hypothetical protein